VIEAMNEYEPGNGRVVVSDQALVNFSHLTAPEQLAAISRIEDVALVIVPESLAGAYAAIPSTDVAATVYVPDGANVRVHTGAFVTGGDGLGAVDDVLILTGILVITSPITGPVPQRIHMVGSVYAPRGSEAALGPALASCTGTVSYYNLADDQDVKVLTGQATLSGATLANPAGQASDVLIAAGQLVITSEVTTIGYRQLLIAGQLAAPAASRDVIEPRVQVQGQVGWYRGDVPRVFYDDTNLGPDFFRLLDQPVSLIVLGDLTIAAGLTEALLREKVAGISVFGDVTAPPELVGVLQALTTDAFGAIRADDGSGS
jgi:voltage-gated potassium channel Kch